MADDAPPKDVQGIIDAGTAYDQKTKGTFKMQFHELQKQFKELMDAGYTDIHYFEKTLEELLRSFETIRISQERHIRDFETKIAWCRARQRAASEHANLILSILVGQVQTAKEAAKYMDRPAPQPENGKPERISDVEMLKTICKCGCVDDEDAKDCDCECHTVGYCSDPDCAVCPDKKEAAEAEAKKNGKSTKKKVRRRTKKATRVSAT
jgi:hypothetical protein